MLENEELWNALRDGVVEIVKKLDTKLIYLIGDKATGKSNIGHLLSEDVLVIDEFRGVIKEEPAEKTLVIVDNVESIMMGNENAIVITTRVNDLYSVQPLKVWKAIF